MILERPDIDCGIRRCGPGLDKYMIIQNLIGDNIDPRSNKTFQKKFKHFYRVRRNSQWCEHYFDLMADYGSGTMISFAAILRELHKRTNRVEGSFASKLGIIYLT